jgi:antirestriction protein ArdC
LSGRLDSGKYAGEELVAEIASAFLCAHRIISPTPRADHAKYLNGSVEKITDDRRAFFTATSAAQQASDYLRGLQPLEQGLDAAA